MLNERDELWKELGVDNQTAAIVRIRGLINRDQRRSSMPAPDYSVKPKPDWGKGDKPNKKFIIAIVAAVVIAIAAVAWHQGMLG